jgi:hypothetical protein
MPILTCPVHGRSRVRELGPQPRLGPPLKHILEAICAGAVHGHRRVLELEPRNGLPVEHGRMAALAGPVHGIDRVFALEPRLGPPVEHTNVAAAARPADGHVRVLERDPSPDPPVKHMAGSLRAGPIHCPCSDGGRGGKTGNSRSVETSITVPIPPTESVVDLSRSKHTKNHVVGHAPWYPSPYGTRTRFIYKPTKFSTLLPKPPQNH